MKRFHQAFSLAFRRPYKTMAFAFSTDNPAAITFADHLVDCSSRIDVISVICYDGRPFVGFQQQPMFTEKTVEAVMLKALRRYFSSGFSGDVEEGGDRITLNAVSRTDADVSAKCQLVRWAISSATFKREVEKSKAVGSPSVVDGTEDRDTIIARQIRDGINALFRADGWPISISRIRFSVPSAIRLRQTVTQKWYSYWLLPMPKRSKEAFALINGPLKEKLGQIYKPAVQSLRIDLMRRAMEDLQGTHDFRYLALHKRHSPSHGKWAADKAVAKGASAGKDEEVGSVTEDGHEDEDEDDADASSIDDSSGRASPSTPSGPSPSSPSTMNPYERFHWFLSDNANSTVRTVKSATIDLVPIRYVNTDLTEEVTPDGPFPEVSEGDASFGPLAVLRDGTAEPVVLRLRFAADGFMRHQLRIITGLLIKIGEGELPPDSFKTLLAVADEEARQELARMLEAKRLRAEGAVDIPAAREPVDGDSQLSRTCKLLGLKAMPKAPGCALVLEKLVTPAELWSDKWFTNNLHRKFLQDWPFLRVHSNSRHYRQYRIDGGHSVGNEGATAAEEVPEKLRSDKFDGTSV
jgi:tRNA pseudouridine(38-40) synthase